MYKNSKSLFLVAATILLLTTYGCKKGTFDINDTNPNVPSTVAPSLILPSALLSTATIAYGNPGGGSQTGNDLFNIYMGYWAVSGDYIPSAALLTYNITSDFGGSIWESAYPTIQNLKAINTYYAGSKVGNNYAGISLILQAYLMERMVNIYNNVPYTQAANSGTNFFPAYDDAKTIYTSLISQLDSSVTLINSATAATDNPGSADLVYGGKMSSWVAFAKTLKLKMLLHLTQTSDGATYIPAHLTGAVPSDFIGAGADAAVSGLYNNGAAANQNPLWQEIGYTTTLSDNGNKAYFRACSYAVNFYLANNDPRASLFYTVNTSGAIKGRAFGSTKLEHNADISGLGGNATGNPQTSGLLQSAAQPAVLISASESLFLQAEAAQRGYITGTAATLYQSAVAESFRLLGVSSPTSAAATYTAQNSDAVNFTTSADKIKTIITQKWAANNTIDPLESWNDWRRLGYPSDLPISIYPGTTATHIPYRLLYPTSENNYNKDNVAKQGTINALTSKIFWMP